MAVTTQMRTEVSQLYVALFGRAPDAEGLNFWAGLRDGGQSMTQVADAMFGTSPARAYFPASLTHQEIISSFYFNVLGRTADAGGLAFWTAKLDAAGATPGSVIAEMIGVIANYAGADPAGLTSAALFNNRAAAAQFYGEHNGSLENATTVLAGVTGEADTVTAARTLMVASGASGTINAAGFSEISVAALSGDLTLAHVGAGTGLLVRASSLMPDHSTLSTLDYELEDGSGSNDSVSVTMKSAGALVVGALKLPGVENLTLTGVDTDGTAHNEFLYFSAGQSLRSLAIAGDVGVLFDTPVHVDRFDATAALATVGGDFISPGPLTILGGSGDDGLQSLYGTSTIDAGAGDDRIWAGGLSVVTGGAGVDVFYPFPAGSRNEFMTIADFTIDTAAVPGDILALGHLCGYEPLSWNSAKLVLGGTSTLDTYLNAATAATDIQTAAHSVARWFQYAGDTYIAIDNTNAATFQDGIDQLVKLTGLVNLSSLKLIEGNALG